MAFAGVPPSRERPMDLQQTMLAVAGLLAFQGPDWQITACDHGMMAVTGVPLFADGPG